MTMDKTIVFSIPLDHWELRFIRVQSEDTVQLSIHWNGKDHTNYYTELSTDEFKKMSDELIGNK